MSEWEGNVQVKSRTNFAESFKIIVPSPACAVGEEQDCGAALRGGNSISPADVNNELKLNWPEAIELKEKKKIFKFKESLKSSN